MGNADKTPDKFTVTTFTSSIVEGVFRDRNDFIPNSLVSIDNRLNSTTDARGGFFFEDVKIGNHYLQLFLDNYTLPYYVIFPVPQGTNWKDLGELSVTNISKISSTTPFLNASKVADKSKPNPEFKPEPMLEVPINYTVILLQEGKRINNDTFFAKISMQAANETLSKIAKVEYFLHPTFSPSVISSDSLKDRFAVSFTGWGFFNLKAKVYFKDGNIQDLSLPIDKWKLTL